MYVCFKWTMEIHFTLPTFLFLSANFDKKQPNSCQRGLNLHTQHNSFVLIHACILPFMLDESLSTRWRGLIWFKRVFSLLLYAGNLVFQCAGKNAALSLNIVCEECWSWKYVRVGKFECRPAYDYVAYAVIKLSGFEASIFLTTKFRGFLSFFMCCENLLHIAHSLCASMYKLV